MCVHMCTHMCTYLFTRLYVYVYTHASAYVHTDTHMHALCSHTHTGFNNTAYMRNKHYNETSARPNGDKNASGMFCWKCVHIASALRFPKEPSFCIWILWIHRNKFDRSSLKSRLRRSFAFAHPSR